MSTQTPASFSQAVPPAHVNSPRAQLGTHDPRKQTNPMEQGLPSSMLPSQLSSTALHFSGMGVWFGTQVSAPERHCIVPFAQSPFMPVSQCCPPELHSMPLTSVTRSSKF